MINPKCDKCGTDLYSYGGLCFSPPTETPEGRCKTTVHKFHLCSKCWQKFISWIAPKNKV